MPSVESESRAATQYTETMQDAIDLKKGVGDNETTRLDCPHLFNKHLSTISSAWDEWLNNVKNSISVEGKLKMKEAGYKLGHQNSTALSKNRHLPERIEQLEKQGVLATEIVKSYESLREELGLSLSAFRDGCTMSRENSKHSAVKINGTNLEVQKFRERLEALDAQLLSQKDVGHEVVRSAKRKAEDEIANEESKKAKVDLQPVEEEDETMKDLALRKKYGLKIKCGKCFNCLNPQGRQRCSLAEPRKRRCGKCENCINPSRKTQKKGFPCLQNQVM
jgi:hypothetical protein